jgi:hypothetical protein
MISYADRWAQLVDRMCQSGTSRLLSPLGSRQRGVGSYAAPGAPGNRTTHQLPDPLESAHRFASLMQEVGFAGWQLQELDTTCAAYVVVRLRQSRGIGSRIGDRLSADAERQTFGANVAELARSGLLAKNLAEQLGAVIEQRNWLVHRARREKRGFLLDNRTMDSFEKRLDRIAEDSLALLKSLGVEIQACVVSSGVPLAAIEMRAARLVRQWGLGSVSVPPDAGAVADE